MRLKVQYKDKKDREKIINENPNLYLIEEQNIIDGNFLVFSDSQLEKEIIYKNIPKEELTDLKKQILELQNYITNKEYNNLLGGIK